MITPVFVYGTLRPQGGFQSAWEPYASATGDGYTTMPGTRLMLPLHGLFPYMVAYEPSEIHSDEAIHGTVGALLIPHSANDEALLLQELDRIEGHPSHYIRTPLVACVVAGPLALSDAGGYPIPHEGQTGWCFQAWTYIASDLTIAMHQYDWQPVLNNDWYQHTQRSTHDQDC